MNYLYKLESNEFSSKRKFACPSCGKPRRFVKYVNTESKEYLDDDVGICDRIESCGYHKTPKDYFNENPSNKPRYNAPTKNKPVAIKPTSFINYNIVDATTLAASHSIFYKLLAEHFGESIASQLAFDYCLGSTKTSDVIFWQVDEDTNTRTGKIMRFKNDFHRDKNTHPKWVHTKYDNFNLIQCLFGLILLSLQKYKGKEVCIVESEKTAILANIIMPNRIWMATGGLHNLKLVKDIKQRVYLYPDKGTTELWRNKATLLGLNFKIIPFMESTNLPQGSDIADLILLN